VKRRKWSFEVEKLFDTKISDTGADEDMDGAY